MITFITALYREAKPILERFGMKKINAVCLCDVFENEEKQLRLLLTGAGSMKAAIAVTNYYTVFPPASTDLLIEVGICGGLFEIGSVFAIHQIVERATQRSFYPDCLFCHPLTKFAYATVQSCPKIVSREDMETVGKTDLCETGLFRTVFDQEASGVFQAASQFLSLHQMLFYKIVSDNGDGEGVTLELVEDLMEQFFEQFFCGDEERILQSLRCYALTGRDSFRESVTFLHVKEFCEQLNCTETMTHSVMQHAHYGYLCGLNVDRVLAELKLCQQSPCQKKQEIKKLLQIFYDRILYGQNGKQCQPGEHFCGDLSGEATRSQSSFLVPTFSTIYMERELVNEPKTQEILSHFPNAERVVIRHYKDLFNRKGQKSSVQEMSKNLILAKKHGTLLYPGAKVCQSFGNEHFYYTSCVMNCIYQCEYCYLKGMYPSSNVVIFINLEDTFAEIDALLQKHPVYLCVSYDTDLLALEHVTGFVKQWIAYAREKKDLRIEIRTKCGNDKLWEQFTPAGNVIFAFTLSPKEIVERYELKTSSLDARLKSARKALSMGYQVRLCLDPMIVLPQYQQAYRELVELITQTIDCKKLMDVSVGSFRISQEYLKKMRKAAPNASVVQYPYTNIAGVYQYQESLRKEMEGYLLSLLEKEIPKEKIYLW